MTNGKINGYFWRALVTPILIIWVIVGGVLIKNFWQTEIISKELYGFELVQAREVQITVVQTSSQLSISYQYDYAGETFASNQLSPYPELNAKAQVDETLRRWLTRTDKLSLMVFVDPDDPSRSSVVRGWAREDRIQGLAYGLTIFTLGLGLLHLVLRPARRVQDLF